MMSQENFNTLSLREKINKLYVEGKFIVAIRYYGYKVNLYLLYNYYVEVFYNHKLDRIEKILPLEHSHSRMNFYSDQIKLPSDLNA